MLKQINIAAVGIIVLLFLWFSWQTAAERRPADLRFVVNSWPSSRLIYAAENKGFFKKYGLKVKIIDVGDDNEMAVDILRRDQAEGGSFPLSEPLRLTSEGTAVAAVASMDYSAGADGIVADTDIQSLTDLKGRRVAVPAQGFGLLLFQEALRRSSLSESDVIIVTQNPLEAVRSFFARQVDAVIATEPYLNLASDRRESHLIFSSAETPGLISDLIVFKKDFIVAQPKQVNSFLLAWFDLIDYLERGELERQEVMAVVAISSGVSLKKIDDEFQGIKLLNFAGNAIAFTYGDEVISLYGSGERVLDFLRSTGRILEPVSVPLVLDPSFIRRGLNE